MRIMNELLLKLQQRSATDTDVATESVQHQAKNLYAPGITGYEPIEVGCTPSYLQEDYSGTQVPTRMEDLEELEDYPHMKNLILGSLLGDMSIMRTSAVTARIVCNHGLPQLEYNDFKKKLLTPLGSKLMTRPNRGYGDVTAVMTTLSHPVLSQLRDMCYTKTVPGKTHPQKYVDQEWIDQLTWEAVAWWICDDGSLSHTKHCYQIATHSFSPEEIDRLIAWFHVNGITGVSRMEVHKKDKTYFVISADTEASYAIASHIVPYVPPCMAYKVNMPPLVYKRYCAHCGKEYTLARQQHSMSSKKGMFVCQDHACQRKQANIRNKKYYDNLSQDVKRERWRARKLTEKQRQTQQKYAESHREELLQKRKDRRKLAKEGLYTPKTVKKRRDTIRASVHTTCFYCGQEMYITEWRRKQIQRSSTGRTVCSSKECQLQQARYRKQLRESLSKQKEESSGTL